MTGPSCLGGPGAAAAAATAAAPGGRPARRLDQVHDREQDNPDEVDEVPVQAHDLDPAVILRRVGAAEGAHAREDQAEHTDRDVRAVEPGHRVEGEAVYRGAQHGPDA